MGKAESEFELTHTHGESVSVGSDSQFSAYSSGTSKLFPSIPDPLPHHSPTKADVRLAGGGLALLVIEAICLLFL